MVLNDGVVSGNPESTSIWNDTPIDFGNSFVINFGIYISNLTPGSRADGITFTFQNEGSSALRITGGGHLGVSSAWNTGISPSIIAEFDVFQNGSYDPAYDHFAVSTNGNLASPIVAATPIPTTGGWHAVTIAWDCNSLIYAYDGVLVGAVSRNTVLSTLGSTTALFGFTWAIHISGATLMVDNFSLEYQGPCTCDAGFDLLLNQANQISTIGTPLGIGATETYNLYDGMTIGAVYSGPSLTNFPLAPGSYEICRTVTLADETSCTICMRFCIFELEDQIPEGPSFNENEQNTTGKLDLEDSDEIKPTISPNPGSGLINITGLQNSSALISVVNVSGQIVQEYSPEVTENYQMNISDLENGIYFIQITQNEQTHSMKFVKE